MKNKVEKKTQDGTKERKKIFGTGEEKGKCGTTQRKIKRYLKVNGRGEERKMTEGKKDEER